MGVPRLRPRRAPTGRAHDAVGEPRHPRGPTRHGPRSRDDAGRGSPRGQEPGVPGGAHPCRGDRAGAGRARGARRARARGRARRSRTPTTPPPARGSSPTADDVWADADLLLKVKEPIAEEYDRLRARPDAVHLPAPRRVQGVHRRAGRLGHDRDRLRDRADRRRRAAAAGPDVRGRRPDGAAGRARTAWSGRTAAAACCSAASPASTPAKVVVIGAGVSGMNAAAIALGMQAEVVVLDRDIDKLRAADKIYQGHLQTVASNAYEVERAVLDADLVIGAVLVAGAKAPVLVSNELVSRMKPGSVLVDIAVDQGGCFEDTRPDDARRPDLPGARLGLLLRGQHAGRRPQHLDARADQRDAALRHGAGQRGHRGGRRRQPGAGARASTSSTGRSCCPRSPRPTG